MAKMLYRRVVMPKGMQRTFMQAALEHTTCKALAKLCECTERTIREWRREKFYMDERSLRKICKRLRLSYPKEITYRDAYWYVSKGAAKGGYASIQKQGGVIGDPTQRLKAWKRWWEKTGKYQNRLIHQSLPIKKPRRSVPLAEFCGIILGDGGISERQVSITLHATDDAAFGIFVTKLTQKLFATTPKQYRKKDSNAVNYVVSRTELVKYLTQELDLVKGNKIHQHIDIPHWIQRERLFLIACVRGLVDTDGSIFTHKYKVKGKQYSYKKLAFSSASMPLIFSVHSLLKRVGLNPQISRNGRSVRLESTADMKRYFRIIGTHNPKHLRRYLS